MATNNQPVYDSADGQWVNGAAITVLTAATGTTGNTISDVTATYTQATLNNNFKALSDKVNAILAALVAANVIAG